MTIAEILRQNIDTARVQLLHECVLGAKSVNGRGSQGSRKKHPAYTRVEFATDNMTVDDLLYWSGELGRPVSRQPRFIGLIVWVPFQAYEAATSVDAVDPQAGSTTG